MIRNLEAATTRISRILMPDGFDVTDGAGLDYKTVLDYADRTGRVLIGRAGENILFETRVVENAFEAWATHRHLFGHHDFTLPGHSYVARLMQQDVLNLEGLSAWRPTGEFLPFQPTQVTRDYNGLIWAYTVGRALYRQKWNEEPRNRRKFVEMFSLSPNAAISRQF